MLSLTYNSLLKTDTDCWYVFLPPPLEVKLGCDLHLLLLSLRIADKQFLPKNLWMLVQSLI